MAGDDYFGPVGGGEGPRRIEEDPPQSRTEFQRDRDRILYSTAFQRLAGITQIASSEVGAHFHNRLTHSLKVAQFARATAQRLGLDEDHRDVVESGALGHDLGHPPFGHVAEEELKELAHDWGGFEANAQSFRILNTLALRDLVYRGLNLTARVLNATLKYPWLRVEGDDEKGEKWGVYQAEVDHFRWARLDVPEGPTLEAQLMDWADDVTYAVHDIEDFHRVGLVPLERLRRRSERVRFFESFFEEDGSLKKKFKDLTEQQLEEALDFLFEQVFSDVTAYNGTRVDRAWIRERTSYLLGAFNNAAEVREGRLEVDASRRAEVAVLKELAWFYIIDSPSLAIVQHGQRRVIRDLHGLFVEAVGKPKMWKLFPAAQQELLKYAPPDNRGLRIATDFVAGLTEEMAYEIHRRLFGVTRGSILDATAIGSR